MSNNYTVVAVFESKAGQEDNLEKILAEAVHQCKANPFNIESRLHKSAGEQTKFFLYENWQSKEQYIELVKTPNIKAFAKKIKSLSKGLPQVCFGYEI